MMHSGKNTGRVGYDDSGMNTGRTGYDDINNRSGSYVNPDDSFNTTGGDDSFNTTGGDDSFNTTGGDDSFNTTGGDDSFNTTGGQQIFEEGKGGHDGLRRDQGQNFQQGSQRQSVGTQSSSFSGAGDNNNNASRTHGIASQIKGTLGQAMGYVTGSDQRVLHGKKLANAGREERHAAPMLNSHSQEGGGTTNNY